MVPSGAKTCWAPEPGGVSSVILCEAVSDVSTLIFPASFCWTGCCISRCPYTCGRNQNKGAPGEILMECLFLCFRSELCVPCVRLQVLCLGTQKWVSKKPDFRGLKIHVLWVDSRYKGNTLIHRPRPIYLLARDTILFSGKHGFIRSHTTVRSLKLFLSPPHTWIVSYTTQSWENYTAITQLNTQQKYTVRKLRSHADTISNVAGSPLLNLSSRTVR